MKKIKILLFVAMSALTISSCSDAIDIVQEGEITDEALFKSTTDLQNYLNGSVYTSVDTTNETFITSLLTDELKIGPANAGQQQGDFRFIVASNNVYASAIWISNYTTINRVNRLLRAAATIIPTPAQTVQYNNVLAQARALRAFAYLRLETYYSTNMKDDNALGVIVSTSVPEILDQTPRSTNAAVWAVVESDIAFAEANLATLPPANNVNNEYFVGMATVSAMKARMYLYRGKYAQAKTAAQDAISQSGLTLTPANLYPSLWTDAIRGEKIFSLSRQVGGPGGNIAGVYTTNSTDLTGSPWWVMGLNLYAQVNSYPSDVRKSTFIDPTSIANTYVINKYPGKSSQPLKNDLKVFRISEMKLIIAEVDARAGGAGLGTAAGIVQEIRNARHTGGATPLPLPVYTATSGALADILKERRVELAFEGHRYIDLKRAGADAGVGVSRNAGDDIFISSTPLTLSLTDYRFTLPIPANEVNGNPTIQQNPGY